MAKMRITLLNDDSGRKGRFSFLDFSDSRDIPSVDL